MTEQQIKNKIGELDYWLTDNPNHPDYSTVLHQKGELERQLAELERQNDERTNFKKA